MNRLLLCLLFFSALYSCTNDILPEPIVVECDTLITYTDTIKTIIDNSCAYAGCHVAGFSSGDYSSYNGMKGAINNGAFKVRISDQRNMPPNNVPSDKPRDLTLEELTLINCWIEDGYLLE